MGIVRTRSWFLRRVSIPWVSAFLCLPHGVQKQTHKNKLFWYIRSGFVATILVVDDRGACCLNNLHLFIDIFIYLSLRPTHQEYEPTDKPIGQLGLFVSIVRLLATCPEIESERRRRIQRESLCTLVAPAWASMTAPRACAERSLEHFYFRGVNGTTLRMHADITFTAPYNTSRQSRPPVTREEEKYWTFISKVLRCGMLNMSKSCKVFANANAVTEVVRSRQHKWFN